MQRGGGRNALKKGGRGGFGFYSQQGTRSILIGASVVLATDAHVLAPELLRACSFRAIKA